MKTITLVHSDGAPECVAIKKVESSAPTGARTPVGFAGENSPRGELLALIINTVHIKCFNNAEWYGEDVYWVLTTSIHNPKEVFEVADAYCKGMNARLYWGDLGDGSWILGAVASTE